MANINQIKVLIVDDEPLARSFIRHLLKNDEEIQVVGECGNGKIATEFITENKPDLVFLDIQMPEMDGFSMLSKLGAENLPAIIFTTAYEEYAIRAFEFHALDYLLKPFDEERFYKSLKFAKERLNNIDNFSQEGVQIKEMLNSIGSKKEYLERFLIKKNGRIIFINTDEIDLIKADDKYVQIFVGKVSHLVRQTLGAMNTQLNPQKFVQVHRSAIINIEKITELEAMGGSDFTAVLENGAKVAVSKSYKNELFSKIGKPL